MAAIDRKSEMARLIGEKDWSATALGPTENWSPALRMILSVLLANRFPTLLWWGPEYVQFYNDAYRPIPGTKHPKSLGQPAKECWAEIWHVLKPLVDTPFNGGPPTWIEDLELEPRRSQFPEETHFTVAYSPVPDETAPNRIGGVLATVHEITSKVIGERRLGLLRDLAARATVGRTAEDACSIAAEILGLNPKDLPFSVLYLLDGERKHARLVGAAGLSKGHPASPTSIDLSQDAPDAWSALAAIAVRQNSIAVVENLASRLPEVPPGPWSDPPRTAVIVPIPSSKTGDARGFLVHGVSSRLTLDDNYRTFFQLIAAQIATAISNAEAYEEERRRAEALAEIDRAKTAFFSNVSHEFRTPLTLMLGPLQDLLSRSDAHLSGTAKEQLELVNRNGARLLRLVNTLLDFSRIEAGRARAMYEATDLPTVTAELASVFRSATERAGLGLKVDCRDLGEPVYVDRDIWEKIVLNLLSNAFKFTFDGEIAISMDRSGEFAELRVRDTGVGIPAEALPRLFERFYRVPDTRSRTHEGSGIGLALVQELVKLHGGSIQVESVVDQGTTFVVSIPFGQQHVPPGQLGGSRMQSSTALAPEAFLEEALRWLPDVSEPPDTGALLSVPTGAVSNSGRGRVLIADDNADMRQYLVRLLGEQYDVETAADGKSAITQAREHPPDLIVSDVMMPEFDGFEVLQQLRADEKTRSIPVILLSARAGEESRVEGMQSGADDYLVKPFSARELLVRVSSRLDIARLQRESEQRMISDLQAMTRLHEIGNLCSRAGDDVSKCLDQIVATAVVLTKADKGNVQIFHAASGALTVAAQRGFGQRFLNAIDTSKDDFACGAAVSSLERVVVEDVTESKIFAGKASLDVFLDAGIRAVQSTPLISSGGRLLGVLSTHFAQPHRPGERELRLLDLLARQAADYLERKQTEAQLAASRAELEQKVEERTRELFLASQELRELSARILQAQDEERRRLARELHDGVGQLLAAASMEVANLRDGKESLLASGETSTGGLESLIAQVNQDIRTMSYLLYPPLLDEVGLRSALAEYVHGFAQRSRIQVALDVAPELKRLDRDLELCLFRIVQECLTNIHRHSESKTASIRIARDNGFLTLEVRDEGKGIAADKLAEIQAKGSGVGIRGMSERIRHFSGDLTLRSDISGTTVHVVVPLAQAESAPHAGNGRPIPAVA
jgi:signal transduction histidine kinase/DNA-binding NarL/FixJ family response regulator